MRDRDLLPGVFCIEITGQIAIAGIPVPDLKIGLAVILDQLVVSPGIRAVMIGQDAVLHVRIELSKIDNVRLLKKLFSCLIRSPLRFLLPCPCSRQGSSSFWRDILQERHLRVRALLLLIHSSYAFSFLYKRHLPPVVSVFCRHGSVKLFAFACHDIEHQLADGLNECIVNLYISFIVSPFLSHFSLYV